MITAINLSDINYDYLETYKLQQEQETSSPKEDTTKHEGMTQTTNSQRLNDNYDLVQSLISQYTTTSKSANTYNNTTNSNNVFARYNTRIQTQKQQTYKEKVAKAGKELLDLQNQLSELVSSIKDISETDVVAVYESESTTDDASLAAVLESYESESKNYINNYMTLYNKLAEKKEEYDNLVKKSGMSEKEISNQFGDKYSDYDETFGNLLSSKTSLQKIPTELADIVSNISENTTERRVIACKVAALATSDDDMASEEMVKLNEEDLQLELQNNAYLKQFKEIAENNNFTQTNMFTDMFKPKIVTLQAASDTYKYEMDCLSTKMSEIQTQLKTETDSKEKEQLEEAYEIYELELEMITTDKQAVDNQINSIQNIDVKNIVVSDEEDIIARTNLQNQIVSINGKMQILSYQMAAIADSDTDSEKLNSLESKYQTYESEITELKKQLQKIEDKYNK